LGRGKEGEKGEKREMGGISLPLRLSKKGKRNGSEFREKRRRRHRGGREDEGKGEGKKKWGRGKGRG